MAVIFSRSRLPALSLTPRTRSARLASCMSGFLLVALLAGLNSVQAWEPGLIGPANQSAAHPALGINDTFGRWTTAVKLVYDPDDAPASFTDQPLVLDLISRAAAEWEQVSGIKFTFSGVDAAAPQDDKTFGTRDGLVRLYWGDTKGAAALAGPSFGSYDSDLGYYPYDDGGVVMTTDDSVWTSNDFFVSTLVHEFGHLLGLGHSDNPQSIMYANPYNFLSHPREDDIRAMQTLYGPPAVAIDPAAPQEEWLYTPPPAASQAVVDAIFAPNSFDSRTPFIGVHNNKITEVNQQTSDNPFVSLYSGGFKGGTSFKGRVISVDPFGYQHGNSSLELSCSAGFVCGGAGVGIAQGIILKSLPGDWKIYLVDEVANHTLLNFTLPVNTTASYNKPPVATVSVAAGSTPSSAEFTVSATDPENNALTVIWHGPGIFDLDNDNVLDNDIRDPIASGGQAKRSFNFSQAGTHTLFISLIDDQPRYTAETAGSSTAGRGFQTLLKVQVSLPLTNPATDVAVTDSAGTISGSSNTGGSTTGGSSSSQTVLDLVSSTTANEQGATTKATGTAGFNTSLARFRLGASKDQGTTTATSFKAGDQVVIAGNANPQAADVGQAASIFLVIRTTTASQDRWTYRDVNGVFRDWNGNIPDLQPATTVSSLKSTESFEIYQGTLAAASHKVYIGYRLSGGSVLHFTGNPMRLEVTP